MPDSDLRDIDRAGWDRSDLPTRAQAIDAIHRLEWLVHRDRAMLGAGAIGAEAATESTWLLRSFAHWTALSPAEIDRAEFAVTEMLAGREAHFLWERITDATVFRAWRENWIENPPTDEVDLAWVQQETFPGMSSLRRVQRDFRDVERALSPANRQMLRRTPQTMGELFTMLEQQVAARPLDGIDDVLWAWEFNRTAARLLYNFWITPKALSNPGDAARGTRIAAALINLIPVPDARSKVFDAVEFESWAHDFIEQREGRFVDAPGLTVV